MKICSWTILLLCSTLLTTANTGFTIKGKVSGIISGTAWIESNHHDDNHAQETPTKIRIVKGEFELTGRLEHPEMVKLHISTKVINVMLENAAYTINEDFSKLVAASLKGGKQHTQFVEFSQSGQSPDAWIKAHPDYEYTGYMANLYYNTPYEKAIEIYNVLSPAVKETHYAKKLAGKIGQMETSRAGKTAPAIHVKTPEGNQLTLQQLAGKIVVIDFWASWCAPCRAYIPQLKKYYETYKDKGVVFLSLSVDDVESKWRTALTEENMPWLQAHSSEGFKPEGMRKLFGFDSIPYLVVIGKDGKIEASLSAYMKQNLQQELERLTGK